ncbi:barstar family protein [Kitasatospora sp. NPDC092948]|uniref:barstar family protein n=1 Tax=Kitasatospora sp. NPDC092948 TaxID=3364088 RepID=UPI003827C692
MAADSPASPLYRLVEDELDREVLSSQDLDGFFVAEPSAEPESVTFIGTAVPSDTRPRQIEDVELRVVDASGKPLAYYYIGRAALELARPSETVAGSTDVRVSFFGHTLPYPGARRIWPRWASGEPIERGEWRTCPPDEYDSWLHVVQHAWFASGHQAIRYGDEPEPVVDGAEMVNIAGFYCALGEAVNGPGGYFGSNPSALEDCLTNRMPDQPPLRLIWRNFRDSEQSIDRDELGYVLSVLRRTGVHVTFR